MLSMQLAAVLLSVSGVGETVLLDFQATWCGPCRSMDATVTQLAAGGYPVRKVDIDQERDLAARFGVQSVPCFIMVVDGREVDRITGATTLTSLQGLFAKAGVKAGGGAIARGQSPDPPLRRISLPRLRKGTLLGSTAPTAKSSAANPFASQPSKPNASLDTSRLLEASVRLTIEDASGYSYGSGTIVDSRRGEALVLTCGHIFRDSAGKGKIKVDLFAPTAESVSGQLVSYDLKRDIGLVAIRTNGPVTCARVAAKDYRVARGDAVTSVGCDNGAKPTAKQSSITAIDKFSGPANLEVGGQPVQGRSGGGLFASDGMLIGVCNAADPADNEGLFAAAATVHQELDRSGLAAVYEPSKSSPAAALAAVSTSPAEASTSSNPRMPDHMPPANFQERPLAGAATRELNPTSGTIASGSSTAGVSKIGTADQARALARAAQAQGAEVICVVRSASEAGKSEVIVLDRVSSTFLEQLAAERQAQEGRQLTSMEVPRSRMK